MIDGRQSQRPLFSARRRSVSVRASRLYAVFFKSCKALCINSNAWQSTQGRLSAGMTLPASGLAPANLTVSKASTEIISTIKHINLETGDDAIVLIDNYSFVLLRESVAGSTFFHDSPFRTAKICC